MDFLGCEFPPLAGIQTDSKIPRLTERLDCRVFGISYKTVALKLGLGTGVQKEEDSSASP